MVKNPVFLASLVLAFLFYSGTVKIKNRHPFVTLAPESKIIRLEGAITSNPVKSSFFGNSYKVSFTASKAYCASGVFACMGETNLFIPADFVEAYYPGKLYSSLKTQSGKGFLIENGAEFSFEVEKIDKKGMKNAFLVQDGTFLGWKGNVVLKKFFRFRSLCRLQFKRLMFAWGNAGGLLLALLSGSREYTETVVSDGFRNSGLSHILALSGMHLGLFGSIARFFGKKAHGRNAGDAVQLLAILFFVWFAGLSPSLFRAFLAALILYLNSLFRMNRPDGLALISVCFIIHVIIFSNHVFEPAFMLSYASLAGIIIFSKMFRKVYPVFIPHSIRLSLSDSTAAQCATAPVSIAVFGKIAPIGIIASLFVSPLVVLFLYAGLFGIIICLVMPFLSVPFHAIMNGLYVLIKRFVLFFEHFS